MKERLLRSVARWTRPWMRNKTPVMHGACKLLLRLVCPRGAGRRTWRLVVPYDGGLVQVDTGSALEYSLLFRGCHEPAIVEWIEHVVHEGSTCLDVGANVGAHALLMARLAGPSGRVIAFEPHPDLCRRLRENVGLNGYRNVTVVEAAVSDADGTASFFGFRQGAFRQGISSLTRDERAVEEMRVHTVDGRGLERRFELERCDLIKIDVEGHDAVVVRSLLETIERHRPLVVFEFRRRRWSEAGTSLPETLERLRHAGYAFLRVEKQVSLPLDEEHVPDGCEIVCVPLPPVHRLAPLAREEGAVS